MVSINKTIVVVLMYFFTMSCFAKTDCRYINGTPIIVYDQNKSSISTNEEEYMCYIEKIKRDPEKKKQCMIMFDEIKNNGAFGDSMEKICIEVFGTPSITKEIQENKKDYAALHPDSEIAHNLALEDFKKNIDGISCDQLTYQVITQIRPRNKIEQDYKSWKISNCQDQELKQAQKSQWSKELKAYRANKTDNQ